MERFKTGRFPELKNPLMNTVVHKCGSGMYESADAVLQDLKTRR